MKKEVFVNNKKEKNIFRERDGYIVYYRCKYCGDWIQSGDFCNRTCDSKFRKLATEFPVHFRSEYKKLPEYDPRLFIGQVKNLKKLEKKIKIRVEKELARDFEKKNQKIPTGSGIMSEMSNQSAGLLKRIEKRVILITLKRHNFDISFSSRILGVSRRTLYNKLEEWNILVERKNND